INPGKQVGTISSEDSKRKKAIIAAMGTLDHSQNYYFSTPFIGAAGAGPSRGNRQEKSQDGKQNEQFPLPLRRFYIFLPLFFCTHNKNLLFQ
ncbi:MAG: hypothetical protein D3903_18280, partial [Candidatus Electrothrix sp. GM3_4]|nr:hypothetical protein [Candidatus Electrothrix sp. GM3_4]